MPVPSIVGVLLAVASGLFIGTSFVLKKVGLLKANEKYNEAAGQGYGYLKNKYWWGGMILMIIGELCNFVAYAFADAILVTPMGALSVVVTTILSAIFLKERLSFIGMAACFICIVGSISIAINAPSETTVSNIEEMKHYVVAPGFLSYAGVILILAAFMAFWAGPRYGNKHMFVYLTVCSTIGGLSVVATQGLGAAIVAQAGGTPQFNNWFLYIVLIFVICTLLTEIIFLNKALNVFNTALVTPTYYVYFTSCTLITSVILFRGIKGVTTTQIISIVLGFLQICAGSLLLQLSKSAKDVPDSKVLTADLGQLHAVADQEVPESEPRADTIRGTAALIRSLSHARQRREADEVKQIHDEALAPIGENETMEWDGLRRRKTTIRFARAGSRSEHYEALHHPPRLDVNIETKEAFSNETASIPPTPPPHYGQRAGAGAYHQPLHQNRPLHSMPSFSPSLKPKSSFHTEFDHDHDRDSNSISISPSISDDEGDPHDIDTTDAVSQISHNPEDDVGIMPRFLPRIRGGDGAVRTVDVVRAPPVMPAAVADTRRQFSFSSVFSGRSGSGNGSGSARAHERERERGHGHGRSRMVRLGSGSGYGERGGDLTEEERLGLVTRDSR